MRYRLFGPLAVSVDGVDHPLTQRRERLVLAMLVASHGRPVSAERLADQLWGEEPPARAAASLQVVISQLRGVLEPGRARRAPATHLVSSTAGYALHAEPTAVDVWRFEVEARRAIASTAADCVAASTAALEAWDGAPYADSADTDLVQSEVARLLELRLAMREARAAALLQLGHPEMVVAEVAGLVEEHPFRERLWSMLAVSQFQTLRQADALATLRTLRERLADELGVDPSPELRALESAVLNQSPELAAHPSVPLVAEVPVHRSPDGASVNPLIGRGADLATVTDAVDRLRAGRGGSVIISGDAGIGKSRLVAAAADYAAAHGLAVAVGRCHEADVAPAYWPWLPVLRALMTAEAPEEVRTLLDADPEAQPRATGASALRSYDAVARLLAASGRQQPLLVVLEDLHWADASSLRLLAFVVEALPSDILLLCTRRSAGASAPEALTAALAAMARQGAGRIRLEGLGVEDVSRLLGAEVGQAAEPLASAVAHRTGGNPFYVIEFGRLLRARLITDPRLVTEVAVPDGIRDVLRLRLDRLPASARPALAIAAVAGTVDPQLITAVGDAPAPEVFSALDHALAAGLLAEREGGYRFVHTLVRETIYTDLPVGERVRLHAAVAEALAPGLAADPELRTELAHHFWLAASLDPRYASQAVRHLSAAAQVADARHAFVESAELWGKAARASMLTTTPGPDRCRLITAQASAQMRSGAMPAARARAIEAMGIARTADRWDLVGEAAAALGDVGSWPWLNDWTAEETIAATLTECAGQLPDGPLAALVLASLQLEHLTARHPGEAHRCGRESVEMARRSGDPGVLLHVLLMRARSLWGPGGQDERVRLGAEMLSLPLTGELEVSALWQYGAALLHAGRPDEADAVMARCLTSATRLRHTGADVPLGWWRFMRAVERDDPRAREIGDAALELHRRSSVVSLEEMTGICTLRTAPVGAEVPADLLRGPAVRHNPAFRAEIAYAVMEAGDTDAAVRLLGPEPDLDAPDFALLASDCLQAGVYAAAGMVPQARRCLDRIQPRSGDVVVWSSADHLGAVDFFIAAVLQTLGEQDAARRHAAAAFELCVRVGNRPWGRRARHLLNELGPGPAPGVPAAS